MATVSMLELVGLVPGGAAAGTMLVLAGLNLLAGMERRLLAEPSRVVHVTVSHPAPVAAEAAATVIEAPEPPPPPVVRVAAPAGPLRQGRRLAQGRAYIGVRLRCQHPVRPPREPPVAGRSLDENAP